MKKLFLLIGVIFLTVSIFAQVKESICDNKVQNQIQTRTNEIFDSLIEIRRDIHQNPELAGFEKRTSSIIEKYLKSLKLKVKANIGGYGVVGILDSKKPGPVIAWRADIDAFTSSAPDTVEFASNTKGVRHICGHDVHTTIALGIANIVTSMKDILIGTAVFIFQPSEENFQGAKAMLEDGLFKIIKPDKIFALHIGPLPSNQIAVKPEEMFAYRSVNLILKMKKTVNNEEAKNKCIELIKKLDTLPGINLFGVPLGNRETGIFGPKCILRGYFVVMENSFQIKEVDESIVIAVKVFSSSKKNIINKVAELKAQLNNSKWKKHVTEIKYSLWQPAVYNDPQLTEDVCGIITGTYGSKSILPIYGIIPMFNDDFAFFQQKIPGVYFFLGGSNFKNGIISMPHAPNFAVDEECIRTGVNYFSSLMVELLNQKK